MRSTPSQSAAAPRDSLIVYLRNGDEGDPDRLGRNWNWRDPDRERRRAWLGGLVRAAARCGFGEIICAQPWGCPPGQWVPEGQCGRLRREDPERFADLVWANALAETLGLRRAVFEGIGRPSNWVRRWLTGEQWVFPDYRSRADRTRFHRHCEDAVRMGVQTLHLDSFAACHNTFGQGDDWVREAGRWGLELTAEGLTDSPRIGRIMWGQQIDRTGFTPLSAGKASVRWIAVVDGATPVMPGGSDMIRSPEQAVRAAQRFRAAGWSICFDGSTVEQIEGVGEAIKASRHQGVEGKEDTGGTPVPPRGSSSDA